MTGRYGIPYGWMTPDTFGEKFGGGRLPPGTRGYTWSNWEQWLAPDGRQQALNNVIGVSVVLGFVLCAYFVIVKKDGV